VRRVVGVVLSWVFVLATVAGARAAGPVATLARGDSAFWNWNAGSTLQGDRLYAIETTQSGAVLRVALDHPNYYNGLTLEVLSPAGASAGTASGYSSMEVFVDDPAVGTWTALVHGGANDSGFRLRAKLEPAAPSPPNPPVPVLPNLRMIPPFEFTFVPPLGAIGGPLPNCSPQEVAETNGRRCLRFSLGPANLGPGPLQVRFEGNGSGVLVPGIAYQRVFDSAGAFTERAAGEFLYHKTHMHYHHSGFGKLELFRIDDPDTGAKTKVGEGPKQGFCTADIMMSAWHRFIQARTPTESECAMQGGATGTNNPTGTMMALTPGWADIYSYSQDGNYVEFGPNSDGRYLVRVQADSKGWILEANEEDNTSYAYIRIAGEEITLLERGYGTGPWDNEKEPVDDIVPGVL
jgi:hypothetical protein